MKIGCHLRMTGNKINNGTVNFYLNISFNQSFKINFHLKKKQPKIHDAMYGQIFYVKSLK